MSEFSTGGFDKPWRAPKFKVFLHKYLQSVMLRVLRETGKGSHECFTYTELELVGREGENEL